jgi:hypothetical protein
LKIIEVQESALPAPKPASIPAIVSTISLLFIVPHLPQQLFLKITLALSTHADRGVSRSGGKHLYVGFVKK